MRQFLLVLVAGVALLSSCTKGDTPETRLIPQGSTISLDVIASTPEAPSKAEKSLRSVDFFIDGAEKVRATLKGKTKVKVHTYIYSGSTLVWDGDPDWSVKEDGKTLKLSENDILLRGTLDPASARLVAVISDVAHSGTSLNFSGQTNLKALVVDNTGNTKVSLPVPFVLSSTLSFDGTEASNKSLPITDRKFKPKGYLLRIKLSNETEEAVEVKGVYINGKGLDNSMLSVNTGTLTTYTTQNREVLLPIVEGNSGVPASIIIPKNRPSDKNLLVWVNKLDRETSFDLDYRDNIIAPMAGYTQPQGIYEEGKCYTVNIKTTRIPNPLSFFSEYPVATDGTSFASTHNYGDPSYGAFSYEEAMGHSDPNLPAGRPVVNVTAGEYTKLPTVSQWLSIVPVGAGALWLSYSEPSRPEVWTRVVSVGNLSYNVTSEATWVLENPYDVNTNRTAWVLDYKSPRGSRSSCYAFRVKIRPHGSGPYKPKVFVEAKYVGSGFTSVTQIKSQPESFWRDAVSRVFTSLSPTYGPSRPFHRASFWADSRWSDDKRAFQPASMGVFPVSGTPDQIKNTVTAVYLYKGN